MAARPGVAARVAVNIILIAGDCKFQHCHIVISEPMMGFELQDQQHVEWRLSSEAQPTSPTRAPRGESVGTQSRARVPGKPSENPKSLPDLNSPQLVERSRNTAAGV